MQSYKDSIGTELGHDKSEGGRFYTRRIGQLSENALYMMSVYYTAKSDASITGTMTHAH